MDAYIVDFARSPFHFAHKGALTGLRPDDMAAQVVSTFLRRLAVPGESIEEVVLGTAYPEGEQGGNLARIVSFLAGLPACVPALTMSRFCGSSMSAIHHAVGHLQAGAGDAFLCIGVESMSRIQRGGFNPSPNPVLQQRYPQAYTSMGITAENVATRYAIQRDEQEAFAVRSQAKTAAAVERHAFDEELVAVSTAEGVRVEQDGCPRPATNASALAALKPAFVANGSVTAGTSSPLTDGAAVTLVARESWIARRNLQPLARIRAIAAAGCDPDVMGMGPVPATLKALERAAIGMDDIGVVELNEAFASQAIACLRTLGIEEERVNLDGGAIALGHPLGATGVRLVGKAAQLLQRSRERYALATQCVGGGQGVATILERC